MHHPRLTVLAAGLVLCGCTSTAPRPGVGDVSFRLSWTGVADLDLYVVSPLGERLSFIRREVDSGGLLDIDCNVRPDPTGGEIDDGSWICPVPMENVFWPRGAGPPGSYRYWAVLAGAEGMQASDTYRLEVRRARRVVRAHEGPVADLLEGQSTFEFLLE